MVRGRRLFGLSAVLAVLGMAGFVLVLGSLLKSGLPLLTWRFLTSSGNVGIGPEILNTVVLCSITMIVTVPLGLLVAVYQGEYLRRLSRRVRELDHLRATLMSAPTIVLALAVYRVAVGWWHWPVSLLTGALALSVINWPFMVTVCRAALSAVPDSYREASLALGASRFETVVRVVIPAALGTLIEGIGMALARLAGESAALIVTTGVNVSQHWSLWGPGETLAVHIWYIRTEGVVSGRDAEAAATGLTLMIGISVVLWLANRVAQLFGRSEGGYDGT